MSFDPHVYIRSSDFPETDFLSLASDPGETNECDQDRFGRPSRRIVDESAIWFTVNELKSGSFGADYGFQWRIRVYANSGSSPRARWEQFAVLFRSLTLIPDSLAYDPQSGGFYHDANEFVEFSRNIFPLWPKQVQQLRHLDLLTADGKPRV